MKVAVVQINSFIGDFAGNMEKIRTWTEKALAQQADMALFPELAVCGYPPMDLLDQGCFVEKNIQTIHALQRILPKSIACGVGFVGRSPYSLGKSLVNTYGIMLDGKLVFEQIKTLLPTYDVFDEARNFESAREWNTFEYKEERIGIAICEDAWRETGVSGMNYVSDPVKELFKQGITLLCAPSASPYVAEKLSVRYNLAKRISIRGNVPFAYINAVGANDSIIFDGRSFAIFPDNRKLLLQGAAFNEDMFMFDTNSGAATADTVAGTAVAVEWEDVKAENELDAIEEALIIGIRDYMVKCGFTRVHLGLSGGIDSALVAYLAVKAVGQDKTVCFSMPSRFSSQGSRDDAAELAARLGCRYAPLPIESVFMSFLETLEPVFEKKPFDNAEENLQARIRGTLLMAYSNKFSSMLLTTGNKSELAMGYCTLYGDTNGALCPIGDLFKTEVFALCRRINEKAVKQEGNIIIPEAILIKPPSAELRPNQKDQDSLPPYEILDEILKLYLFDNLSKEEIADKGWDVELVAKIIKTVAHAEFKRRQAPPVLKVSKRAFGMGRRMPIARDIYEVL
ncbi:MAG: NAD+ synthase [Treponema sp.]|jgi:NAD+ synthase (glutamine-hydrolysing)|nr:NAD+ synthase [Treponema sp.]